MEYANGGELFDYIVKNEKIDEVESCKFLDQLLLGIKKYKINNILYNNLVFEL